MTKTELIQQIRFGIEQLKATNGTLSFEHICRFFARARIARNVIPATGPVQSHGDQGRDFETFHSYLSNTSLHETCSIGYASKPIAFPCSLEKNPLKKNGKIDTDIKTIMESGSEVERIYFFSGEDIPVGSRHKKQQEVKENYGVELEIIDAQAISEHLSDSDLFWIASQFLNIPNDFFPRKTEENWYNISLKEYKEREVKITFEEFNEIKSAIRYIYKDDILKVDLPFWLAKLEIFLGENVPRDLKRKTIYEKYIAKLMGQNDTTGLEDNIRDYFSDVNEYTSPASLDDAQILLTFVQNSKVVIGSLISDEEVNLFKKNISNTIDKELKNNISGSKRCSYMEVQANMLLNNSIQPGDKFVMNTSGYVNKLEEILPKLDNAPFFPLERLAKRALDYLGILLEFGGETQKIEEFIKKLDVHLAKRHSELSIGDSIRDRALMYMKANKVSIAINLLHQLKIKWFANEATRGVILTTMLLADCYSRLEMAYASKYYNLIAADMSLAYGDSSDVMDLFPRAMKSAADSAYVSGSWLHYLEFMYLALSSSHMIEKDFNIYESTSISTAVYYPALIKYFVQKFDMPVSDLIERQLEKWDYVKAEIDEAYRHIKSQKDLFSTENIEQSLSEQLLGLPLNDIGEIRTIKFNIYGSDWSVKFENNYATNAVAEQFVSMLQVYLVELSDSELFLTKANVVIDLSIAKDSAPVFKQHPSNVENIWSIQIPRYSGDNIGVMDRYQINYVAIIASILRGISLLPDLEMNTLIGKKLSSGLLNAVTFGQTYHKLYCSYISEEDFTQLFRETYDNEALVKNFKLKENTALKLNQSLSPTYSKEKNLEIIQKRINHKEPFSITLEKMKNNPAFMQIINELRKDWLDWQIYLAFGNLLIRFKLEKLNIRETNLDASESFRNTYLMYSSKPEKDWYMDIPLETFSKTDMQKYLEHMNIATVLPSYGLEFHSNTPDTSAIKDILIQRFNFLEDGKEVLVF